MKKVKIMGKPKSYIGLIKTQYDKSFLHNNYCSHSLSLTVNPCWKQGPLFKFSLTCNSVILEPMVVVDKHSNIN